MAKKVRMPDGQIVSFPDTHTDDQIGAFIDEHFPELAAPKDSALTSAFVGAGQGATANTLGHATQKAIDFTDSLASSDNSIASYIGEQLGGKRGGSGANVSNRLKQVQEANPGAYTTGEITGAVLAPTGKVGAIPKIAKMGTLGKLGAVGGVNMAESALNAYNTDGNIAQSMGISGAMSVLPTGVSKLSKWSGATDKIQKFADDRTLAALGFLNKFNTNSRLGTDRAYRTEVASKFRDTPRLLFKGAEERVDAIQDMIDPYSRVIKDNASTVAQREASTGVMEGALASNLRNEIMDAQRNVGAMKKVPIKRLNGGVDFVDVDAPLLKGETSSSFGKMLDEVKALTPTVEMPPVMTRGRAVKTPGAYGSKWVPGSMKPNIGLEDPAGRLSLQNTLDLIKTGQEKSNYESLSDAITNKFNKKSAYAVRKALIDEGSLPGAAKELRNIAVAQKEISPLLSAKTLSGDEWRRNANRSILGTFTPAEAGLLAGGGMFSAYNRDESSMAYPLAAILARRYGNAAMATGLNRALKSAPSTGNGLITAPLRYFSSKGNE